MAKQILALHWKAVRWGLLPFVVAAFALPLVSVQGLGGDAGVGVQAMAAVESLQAWLAVFPLLAGGAGVTLALSAWNWDHQGNHVYALSLPVSRGRYALLKLGAGVVLSLIPAVAFLAGSFAATAAVDLPAGLHAYPLQLTLRFLMAMLITYGFMFALAAGTVRTAVIVITAVVALPILSIAVVDFLANFYPSLGGVYPIDAMMRGLVEWPGPFQVFTGNWMLIDV